MTNWYHRGNYNPWIEGQTTQWPIDTIGAIRISKSKDRQHNHCVVCPSSIYRFGLPLWYILAIVLSVLLRFTDSDCPYGIYWPLCCLFLFDLRILIAAMVYIGHCVVCPSSIYWFWLPLWYLLVIVLSVLRFTDSDCRYGIYWPLCCLSFDLLILIAPMVSIGHCVVCPSYYGL
jgi:hypothetical protein